MEFERFAQFVMLASVAIVTSGGKFLII